MIEEISQNVSMRSRPSRITCFFLRCFHPPEFRQLRRLIAACADRALDGAGDPRERAPLLVEKGDELELLPWPESGEDVHHDELDDAMENAKKAGGPADPNKKHFSPVKLRAHALT